MIVNRVSALNETSCVNKVKVARNDYFMSPPNIQASNDLFVRMSTKPASAISFKAIKFEEVEELTRVVSEKTFPKKKLIKIYQQYPDAQGITLGDGLSSAWLNRIEDISKFNKNAFCERLGEIFTIDRHFSDIDVLSENLTELFKEHKILKNGDVLNTEYLGKGFFGRAFKVDINGEDSKVLKEFKRTYRYHNNHGNYAEQNIAGYINNYSGSNTNMVRYYYGDTKMD